MSIDTAPLFTATAEHLIGTVAQARADLAQAIRERDEARADAEIERRLREALGGQLEAMKFELRVAHNAPAYWKARAEQAEAEVQRLREQAEAEVRDRPTVELPRVQPVPEPVRRRTGSRSRRGKR